MNSFFQWLNAYEALAVWLEGIALVAIFIWDRVDAKRDHDETLRQIKLVEDQITVSQNAERAWVMTYLDFGDSLPIAINTSRGPNNEIVHGVTVSLKLRLRNEGRSPAFIHQIQGWCKIVQGKLNAIPPSVPNDEKMKTFAPIDPIGPDKEDQVHLYLDGEGSKEERQWLVVFVVVEYRDIFDKMRSTRCGYAVNGQTIARFNQLAEYNRMT
jgi:hypothetical protein